MKPAKVGGAYLTNKIRLRKATQQSIGGFNCWIGCRQPQPTIFNPSGTGTGFEMARHTGLSPKADRISTAYFFRDLIQRIALETIRGLYSTTPN
jgi:hypothetical protein